MAPQQRRPIVALRIRVRRRIQNFTGIISGTYPGDLTEPLSSEHYRRGSSSSNASRNYKNNNNNNKNRNSRCQPKRSSTWSSLSSITESDESEQEEREPLVQTPSNQSAESTNPFSDIYASDSANGSNEDEGHSTGLELVRVNNNSERDMQVVRHRSPYTTTTTTTAAAGSTYRISIPNGIKWKSTPGAYAFTAPVKPISKVDVPAGDFNPSTQDNEGAATPEPPTPRIHEIDWNHNLTGPYATQSLRPANPRTTSRRLSSLAYSHPDSSTMMAMIENSTPACDLMAFGGGPTNFRATEFEALGMMGYDLQWLEYMSIPSGGLGKLKRWVGRRLGLNSSSSSGESREKGMGGSGGVGLDGKGLQRPATIGCAADVKSSMRPAGLAGAGKRVRFSTA